MKMGGKEFRDLLGCILLNVLNRRNRNTWANQENAGRI